MKKNQQLFDKAFQAMQNAYAPYSHFKVGAAVLADDGNIYAGCNTENISYPCGTCAEAGAIAAMAAAGARKIIQIMVISDGQALVTPCGACLQRIKEFSTKETEIITADINKNFRSFLISDLLPHAFEEF